MSKGPTKLAVQQPLMDGETAAQHFRTWLNEVSQYVPIVDSGTPEGVVAADQYQHYIDEADPSLPVHYWKMLSDISGDKTRGWVSMGVDAPTDTEVPDQVSSAEKTAGTETDLRSFSPKDVADMVGEHESASGLTEYLVPIWAEEGAALGDSTYEWAFGNGANTPSNAGITIYVPSGMQAHIVAMTGTTNSASGTSVIEADVNGSVLGVSDGVEVTLAGRSGSNDSFTPYALSSGDRLNFRTRTAGTNTAPSTVTAWIRYQST